MVAGNEDVCYNCWRAGKWVPFGKELIDVCQQAADGVE